MNLTNYLKEFKTVAEEWFGKNTVAQDFYSFFKEFLKKENLEKADWEDFQKMGNHIHSFNSMAIAKSKALGKPNHPIEHYRKSLIFLVHGEGEAEDRVKRFATDKEYKLKNFGNSALSELIAWSFPDRFMTFNKRDKFAVNLIGIKPEPVGESGFIGHFLSFNKAIEPVLEEYEKVVGKQTELPLALEVDQFFSYLYEKYHADKPVDKETAYWVMAPGTNAKFWNECLEKRIILYGADELPDLSQFGSKQEITDAIKKSLAADHEPTNDGKAAWQFVHDLKIGDYIFAKRGAKEIIGYGKVVSDYYRDESRPTYRNIRNVEWLATGNWSIPEDRRVPLKALTEVTKFSAFLDWILPLVQNDKEIGTDAIYSTSEAMDDLFLSKSDFDEMIDLLKAKKNIILQGPPGVGKSFIAKRVAYALIGKKDPAKVGMIQFHQAYSYEDFIQGYRPGGDGGSFHLKNGIFYDFCKKAAADPDNSYVFIIDEINRGNLSKIFGELMLLIEADKRSTDFAITLTYSQADTGSFYITPNVYLIGMMNTADRSLAMVDYALRRRFRFVELKPEFSSPKFKDYLSQMGVSETVIDKVIKRMDVINSEITQDSTNLGKGYCIGHSFFCPEKKGDYGEGWYKRIITYEIAPLIREYWFDNNEKAESTIEQLLKLT